MDEISPATVSMLLAELRDGDRSAFDKLFPLVYDELHGLARAQRRAWRGNETLDTTALLHEAYLKLVAQTNPDWEDRAHFLSVAARAMRQILIDYARTQRREKRGGDRTRVSLNEFRLEPGAPSFSDERAELLVALDDSLKRLEERNERQSRIVECRFFGGMTIRDTARALGVSPATVKRGWAVAQAWLYQDIREGVQGEAM